MASVEVEVPDFEFTAFYYPDIFRSLILFNRLFAPEITDEDDREPYIQLLKAFALVGHLNNVNLDIVANEALFGTARLLESVRNHLALIGVKLEQNIPATTEEVLEFSKIFLISTNIVPADTQFATEETDDTAQVVFETNEDNVVSPTDKPTAVFQEDAGVFGLNKTGEASTPAVFFNMFATTPLELNDRFYIGHDSIMWDTVEFVFNNVGSGIFGVWEFYDGTFDDAKPDTVTNLGPNLKFELNGLLGTSDRSGTEVTVKLNETGASEVVESTFSGGVNIIETTGLLGQAVVSTDRDDYTVGTDWNPLSNVVDATSFFTEDGKVTFSLPQTEVQNWIKTVVNGIEAFWVRFRVISFTETAAAFTGTDLDLLALDSSNYNIKIKINGFASTEIDVTGDAGASPGTYTLASVITEINTALNSVDVSLASVASDDGGQLKLTSPTTGQTSLVQLDQPSTNDATFELLGLSELGTDYPHQFFGIGGIPSIDRVRIDTGKQFLIVDITQGESQSDDPLGSSNGGANQEFELTQQPLIEGTLVVEVDEGDGFTQWNLVENFLNSSNVSKDYTVEVTADDVATIKFGNGQTGKIPALGSDNIRAFYKTGADVDGNVGARTINVNKGGIAFVNRVFNPRQAKGHSFKEGSTPADIARIKIEGPAELRARNRGITPADYSFLATEFKTSAGSKIVERCLVIEETFGVKTIEGVVVGTGGALLTEGEKDQLDDFFNGNKVLKIEGVGLANHQFTAVNYTRRIIDVEAVVTGGNEEQIKNAIAALLSPVARFDDGATFRWDFEDEVPRSLITGEIFAVDRTNIKKVDLILPAADITLAPRELPFAGTITITVV